MMNSVEKIVFRKDVKVLSEREMQQAVGGYEGSGTYEDPYQLPEVVISLCIGPSGPNCKIIACEGISIGETCSFCYNNRKYKGKCAKDAFWGKKYCCDLC
jgi:hypothetical protein